MSTKYIVVFKKDVTDETIQKHADELTSAGGDVQQRFSSVLRGFSAAIPESYLSQLQSLTGGVIDYIEPDGVVTTQ